MINLSTENKRIRSVIDDYSKGVIAIPEFQRDYVWKPNKVLRLIDSIYKSFPTGTLLVWKPKIDEKVLGRAAVKSYGLVYWLIDGQQRTRSLYESLKEGNVSIYFNPIEEKFALGRKKIEANPLYVNLLEILDTHKYTSIKKSLRESFPDQESQIDKAIEKCRAILDYELPVVIMNGHTLEDAIQAFERINTSGTRLKSADISAAKLTFHHTGFINKKVSPLMRWLAQKNFDRVYTSQIFMACSAIAKQDPKKKFSQLHTVGERELDKAWSKTENGIKWAISTVCSELNISDMKLLWSGALLMPLVVIHAVHKPSQIDVGRLIKWLLLASIHHRYSGQAQTKLADDLNSCLCVNPIDKLLSTLKKESKLHSLEAHPDDFDAPMHDKFILLALYMALQNANAKDLLTGQKITYQSFLALDRHHLFPISRFEKEEKPSANTISNIALITADSNKEITNKWPVDYLSEIKKERLSSQLIPLEVELWEKEKFKIFKKRRNEMLSSNFNEFINSKIQS